MRSLRARLALAAVTVVVLLTAIAALLVATDAWRRSFRTMRQVAGQVAADTEASIRETNELVLPSVAKNERLIVLGADNRLLVGNELFDREFRSIVNLTQADVQSLRDDESLSGDFTNDRGVEWSYSVVRCLDPAPCGAVVAASTPLGWSEAITNRLGWIALAVGLAGLLTWFGSRWLIGRSLRPVEAMRSELDSITATDLSRRVPVPPTGDELERLGTSLNLAVARIEDALAAQQRFASDAAHELRSPLSGIRTSLELAALHPDRSAAALPGAIGQVDRAARLVDDLLELSRRDAGVPERPRTLLDLDEVVRSEVADAAARHGDCRFEGSIVEPVQVRGATGELQRAIRNLVDNAALHGGGEVRVRCVRQDDCAVVTVDDDGPAFRRPTGRGCLNGSPALTSRAPAQPGARVSVLPSWRRLSRLTAGL